MEFLIKIKASDSLRQSEIIKDLRDGLKLVIGGGDPACPYLHRLKQVRIIKFNQAKKIDRFQNLKGGQNDYKRK